jgi:anti-sigma regulatory factor (Ser/Thr protein kinase)
MSANAADAFVHEGLFYRDADEYLAGMLPFIRSGFDADEPVLVAVPWPNLTLIRDSLGSDAERVRFRDMAVAGRNPSRIIPTVLLAFVTEHPAGRVRVIGEPIWPGRTATEYPACVQHEALINVALHGRAATILCPYDASRLDHRALADARGTHPVLVRGEQRSPCDGYVDPAQVVAAYNEAMPEPSAPSTTLIFREADLPAVRRLVADRAKTFGLTETRAVELQLAAHEVATNAIKHADGVGTLRIWREQGSVVCEIRDGGRITDLLAGRRPASSFPGDGRGLLLVNSLCDLVRIHNGPASTTTRLYMDA